MDFKSIDKKGTTMEFLAGNSVGDDCSFARLSLTNGVKDKTTTTDLTKTDPTKTDPTIKVATMGNIAKDAYRKQSVIFPSHHKRRIDIIERSKYRAQYYIEHPHLAYGQVNAFFHKNLFNKNGRRKMRRRIVRERLSAVIQVLLHYSSISHLIFGCEINGHIHHFTTEKIVELTGETYKRIYESLRILQSEGYIHLKEQRKKLSDNRYRSRHAIILINPQLYFSLGVSEEKFNQYRIDAGREIVKKLAPKDYIQSKKEFKAMRERLREVNEMPGSERKRESAPLYRDYTGLHDNRDAVLARNQPTQTAKSFLAEIMQKLKPPS